MAASNHEDGTLSDAQSGSTAGVNKSSKSSARKERTSVCSFCGMTFNKKEHLQRHERTHTLARPYECDFPGCGKSFARRDTLTRHTRLHQREELQGSLKSSLLNALGDDDEMTDEFTTPAGSKQPSPTSSVTALATVATSTSTPSTAVKGKKSAKNTLSALKSSRRGSSSRSNAGSSLPSSKKTTPEGKASEDKTSNNTRISTRPRRAAAVANTSYDESAIMDDDTSPEVEEEEDEDATAAAMQEDLPRAVQNMDMDMDANMDIKPDVRAISTGSLESRRPAAERVEDSIKPLLPSLHTSSFLTRSLEAHHAMSQNKPTANVPAINNASGVQQPMYNFAAWDPATAPAVGGGGHLQGPHAHQHHQQTGLTATANGNTALLGYSSSANSSTSSSGSTFASAGTNSMASQASPYSFSGSPLAGNGNGISALGLDLGLPPSPASVAQHNASDGRQYFQSFSFSGSAPPGNQQHYRQQPYQSQQQPQQQFQSQFQQQSHSPPQQQGYYAPQQQQHQQQQAHHHQQFSQQRTQSQPFVGDSFSIFQSPNSAFNNNTNRLPSAADVPLAGNFDAVGRNTTASAISAAGSPTSTFFGLNSSYSSGPSPTGPPGSQGYSNQSPSTAAQSFLASGAGSSYSPQLSPCEPLSERLHSIPLPDVRSSATPLPATSNTTAMPTNVSSSLPQSFVPGLWSHMSISLPAQMQSHMQMPMQRSHELMQAHQAHHRHLSNRSFSTTDEFELISSYSSAGSPESASSLLATSPTLAAAAQLPYTATSPVSETSTLPSLSSSFSSAFSGDYLTSSSSLANEEPMMTTRSIDDPLAAAFKYKTSSMQPLTIVDPSSTSLSRAPMDMGLMLKAADAHTDQFINWPDREASPLTFSGFSPETPFGSSVNTAASPSIASYLDLNDYDVTQSAFFGDKTFTMPLDLDRTLTSKVSDEEAGRQSPIASLEDWLNKQTSASDFVY